jgi:hypothetical protein
MQKMSTPDLEFIKKNIKNRNKNLSDADLDRMANDILQNYLNSNSEKIKKDKQRMQRVIHIRIKIKN